MEEDRYSSMDDEKRKSKKLETVENHLDTTALDDEDQVVISDINRSYETIPVATETVVPVVTEKKDISSHRYDEETSAEFAEPMGNRAYSVRERDDHDGKTGTGFGAFALIVSILSLFFMPVILGIVGIILGFIARRRGASTLGAWAIGVGVVSIIVGIFIMPFF